MSYAAGTYVEAGQSRVDIERLLSKQGCSHVGVMHEPGTATVIFRRSGWEVEMRIPLPNPTEAPKASGFRATTLAQREKWAEQKTRERWRQLLLVLKAKFTALDEGVETFEQSFMAHLVLGGTHLGDKLLPAVREAKEKGSQLLLGAGEAR